MKKLFIILLMLVYGLSSTGMSISVHYCCGKFNKINFSSSHDKGCAANKKYAKKKCCDDREVELKLTADQEPGAKYTGSFTFVIALPANSSYREILSAAKDRPINQFATGPPLPVSLLPLFIRNCVFLI